MFGCWGYRKRVIVRSGIMLEANGFAIVSQDADFAEMAVLLRPSPKVIWLRIGNQSTATDFDIASASCRSHSSISKRTNDATCLEIY